MNPKILFLSALFSLIFTVSGISQSSDSLLYQRFPDIPPFSLIQLPDSSNFAKKDLKKNRPVLIFVFSPDCDHCKAAMRDLLNHYSELSKKKLQIVMATPLEYKWIVPFYEEFELENYSAIHIGRDPTHFLGTFFGIHQYPALFLYNKKGKFSKAFPPHTSFEDVLKAL